MKKKTKKPKSRSGVHHAAISRVSSGPMKHRLEPKKGSKNEQAELLNEVYNRNCICDDPDPGIVKGCPVHDPVDDEYEIDL